jgi:hypothetical protein
MVILSAAKDLLVRSFNGQRPDGNQKLKHILMEVARRKGDNNSGLFA